MSSDSSSEATLAFLCPDHKVDLPISLATQSQTIHGSHLLPLKQSSRSPEFSRPYAPGDPLRMIDWKAYARTDQLIVREERKEARIKIFVLVAYSPSMLWPHSDLNLTGPSKWEIAMRIALHLLFFHHRLGDEIGLALCQQTPGGEALWFLKPRTTMDILRAFDVLKSKKFENVLPQELGCFLSEEKDHSYLRSHPPETFYWVGDLIEIQPFSSPFYQKTQEKSSGSRAKTLQVYHTLSQRELDLEWMDGGTCYFYSEAAREKENFGSDLKDGVYYQDLLHTWQKQISSIFFDKGCPYFLVTEETALSLYMSSLKGKK
ncbi:MAG: DUF58 domain-containing protein [Oligoflexales bacterium]|nr:DUF58 domain-containing protein [Oligoflexales bacterium]